MFTMNIDSELELQLQERWHAPQRFTLINQNRDYLRKWLTDYETTLTVEDEQANTERLMRRFAEGACTAAVISYRGSPVGGVALHTDYTNRSGDIGYWLAEASQGKGIMTRVCRTLVDHAFEELGFNRVSIFAASGNLRSRAVPERLGFTKEGVVRRTPEWEELDSVAYGILAREWSVQERRAARFGLTIDDGIELRLLEQRHSENLFKLVEKNRDRLSMWFPWVKKATAVEDIRKFILQSLEKRAQGRGCQAGIWVQGQLAGVIGHARLNTMGNWAEIGYWLDADYEGSGIMTKTCRTFLDDAFKRRGLRSVEIRVPAGNQRRQRVPERLGFQKEAVIRESDRLSKGYVDMIVYGLLRNEWVG